MLIDKMDPLQYLEAHNMLTYISDAIAVLTTRKRQDPSKSDIALLAQYFQTLKLGVHVYGREFEYVTATPYNRICFIRLFWQCFYALEKESMVMKVTDYLQLLRLLCPNFPTSFVSKIKSVLRHSGNKTSIRFQEFIYIFQVTLYYEGFLAECEKVYTEPSTERDQIQVSVVASGADGAVLATNNSQSEQKHLVLTGQILQGHEADYEDSASKPHEGISMFAEQVLHIRDKLLNEQQWQCLPEAKTLRHILLGDSRVTSSVGLIVSLVQSNAINLEIGILPNKNNFHCIEPPPLPVLQYKIMDWKSLIQVK